MNENPMEQVEQTPETPAEEPVPAPEQKKGLSENAKEWIKDITGREFTPKDFLDYLEEKYGELYCL